MSSPATKPVRLTTRSDRAAAICRQPHSPGREFESKFNADATPPPAGLAHPMTEVADGQAADGGKVTVTASLPGPTRLGRGARGADEPLRNRTRVARGLRAGTTLLLVVLAGAASGAATPVTPTASGPIASQAQSAQAGGDTFSQLFPGFLQACAELHDLFVPFALALLVLSFVFAYWHGPLSGPETIRYLCKLFLVILLITHAHTAINDAQAMLQHFLEQHIPARAENVAQLYAQKLAEAQQAPDREDQGFFHRLLGAGIFESIIGACLLLISWAGMGVTFFVFMVLKIALLLAWTISPVMFALFVFPAPLSGLAWRHFLRLVGYLLTPLSLALAATVSQGILDGMVKDGFLKEFGLVGSIGYGLNNLLSLALLAAWIIFSTVTFPIATLRLVSHGGSAASAILRGGDLAVNLGLPTFFGLAAGAWSRFHQGAAGRGSAQQPQPVPAMSPDTPEPPPTGLAAAFAAEADPTDPLGQRRVDAELESLQGHA